MRGQKNSEFTRTRFLSGSKMGIFLRSFIFGLFGVELRTSIGLSSLNFLQGYEKYQISSCPQLHRKMSSQMFFGKVIGLFQTSLPFNGQLECSVHILRGPCPSLSYNNGVCSCLLLLCTQTSKSVIILLTAKLLCSSSSTLGFPGNIIMPRLGGQLQFIDTDGS